MDRPATTRACVIAWLLYAVLACLVVHSPHCGLCDGPYFVTSSHQSQVNHPLPSAPDTCNGICSCCRFRGLPNIAPALDLVILVTTDVLPESSSPVPGPHSPIFRPPRIAVSSQLVSSAPFGGGHTLLHPGDIYAPMYVHARRSVPGSVFVLAC